MSQPIQILSAGAPKGGVSACAKAFEAETGRAAEIEFATAPAIRERVEAGRAKADIVVAPDAAMQAFVRDGRIVADTVSALGSVAAGVVVRNGAAEPDLSSVESFRAALLAADALVYNQASSGRYIAAMIERLGIADQVAAKTVRPATGSAVIEYLAGDRAEATIGFGQITEIRRQEHLGAHLVGPLPGALANATTYAAGVASDAADHEAAAALVRFMASPPGKRIFADSGVA